MSIHSNVYNIVQVLSKDGDLRVPWFQRDYTWDEDNVNELFSDIFEEYSWLNIVKSAREKKDLRDYFLGAVMLCGPSDRPRMILDGQQRITTISIIIACLIKRMSQFNQLDELAEKGTSILFNDKREPRLLLKDDVNDTDHKIFKQIINSLHTSGNLELEDNELNLENKELSQKQIYNTYKHISEKLDQQIADATNFNYSENDAIKILFEILITKLMMISVQTDDEDYAIKFFETLNARGEDLRSDDLIKNALLLEAQKADPQLVVRQWNEFAALIKDPNSRIDFLRYYWNSRFEYISKSRLFKSYKSHFKAFDNNIALNIDSFCKNLVFSANYYKEISKVKGKPDIYTGLIGIGSKISRPLLLAVNFKFKDEDPRTLDTIQYQFARLIESVMLRCVICDQLYSSLEQGFGEAAKIVSHHPSDVVSTIIKDIKKLFKNPLYKVPADNEIKTKLNNIVLNPGDLNKSKWRVFFATLDVFMSNPAHIVIPRKPNINLSFILAGDAQYHKSLGNIRVVMKEDGPTIVSQSINLPHSQTVGVAWNQLTIAAQKARVIDKALECWSLN